MCTTQKESLSIHTKHSVKIYKNKQTLIRLYLMKMFILVVVILSFRCRGNSGGTDTELQVAVELTLRNHSMLVVGMFVNYSRCRYGKASQ